MLPHADVLVPGGGRAQVDQLGLQGLVVIRGGVWVVVLVHIVLTTSSALSLQCDSNSRISRPWSISKSVSHTSISSDDVRESSLSGKFRCVSISICSQWMSIKTLKNQSYVTIGHSELVFFISQFQTRYGLYGVSMVCILLSNMELMFGIFSFSKQDPPVVV